MFINVNNIRLYYEKHGEGNPLILLHGNEENHFIFDEAVEKLKKYYTVYTLDSRGHGQSEKVKEYHYQDMANDIKNFEESKPNMLVLNITNLTEEQKAKLRGAIKFFNGEQNNIRVMVKINEELKPCGAIYLTDEILKVFEEIVGKENCQ